MTPASFPEQNHVLEGGANALDVPMYRDNFESTSCWQLNKEEIDEINRTGKIWFREFITVRRFKLTTFNPFTRPREMIVNPEIRGRVFPFCHDGDEVIFVAIESGQMEFLAEKFPGKEGWWTLSYKIEGSEMRHYNNYDFAEEVRVMGMSIDFPEYLLFTQAYRLRPEIVLLLERVNKTQA